MYYRIPLITHLILWISLDVIITIIIDQKSIHRFSIVPEVGGHTNFRNAGVHVKPTTGGAVFFSYIDPDKRITDKGFTEHSGCPVHQGVKKIVTQWIRLGVDEDNPWNSFNSCKYKEPIICGALTRRPIQCTSLQIDTLIISNIFFLGSGTKNFWCWRVVCQNVVSISKDLFTQCEDYQKMLAWSMCLSKSTSSSSEI